MGLNVKQLRQAHKLLVLFPIIRHTSLHSATLIQLQLLLMQGQMILAQIQLINSFNRIHCSLNQCFSLVQLNQLTALTGLRGTIH
jgi:hypothetical protein